MRHTVYCLAVFFLCHGHKPLGADLGLAVVENSSFSSFMVDVVPSRGHVVDVAVWLRVTWKTADSAPATREACGCSHVYGLEIYEQKVCSLVVVEMELPKAVVCVVC